MPDHIHAWPEFIEGCVTGRWSANTYHTDLAEAFVKKARAVEAINDALDAVINLIADRREFHCANFKPEDELAVEEWRELERLIGDLRTKDFLK